MTRREGSPESGGPRRLRAVAAGLCLAAVLSGCASVGPATVPRDRFDYVTSISDSWKSQMLLNLLKVRYADAPVFLDVTSVINSYELNGKVDLGRQVAPAGRGDTFTAIGGSAFYADRPTITYAPLSSDKYAKSLMAPIPVSGILLLIQGGYPADFVLRVCVNSINGLQNYYGGPVGRHGDAGFHEILMLLREAQATGSIGMKARHEQPGVMMFLRPPGDAAAAVRNARIAELLGLNPKSREFGVVFGPYSDNDTEVAIESRSLMQILIDFGSYADVPDGDIAEGRVYAPARTADDERLFPPLLRVQYSPARPDDAHVAVRYRDGWFWIDDRDHYSKTLFNFVMQLFSLTETGSEQAAPIVTVPAR